VPDDEAAIPVHSPVTETDPPMRSFRLRVSTLLATILAAAVLAEAGAGSPTVPTCAAPAGGWNASNGAQVTPARESRLVVLVDRYRRQNGLHAAKLGKPGHGMVLVAPSRCGPTSTMRAWRASPRARRVLLSRGLVVRFVRPDAPSVGVTPAIPPVELPPLDPPPAPLPPPVGPPPTVVGVPYTCTGPVDNVRVVGSGESITALVNLAEGCTGTISVDLTVTPGGGDGVKVQAGAHDLVVGPSRVTCQPGVPAGSHQDGVQVQGGSNVTFKGLVVSCPSSPGAAAFYIDGKDFPGISNVTCDGCDLTHMVRGALFTAPAPGSGVRNSRIHQGTETTHAYYEIVGSGAMNENNMLVPRA
jgi:hypothetical protein